jgi:hypothetical protein
MHGDLKSVKLHVVSIAHKLQMVRLHVCQFGRLMCRLLSYSFSHELFPLCRWLHVVRVQMHLECDNMS